MKSSLLGTLALTLSLAVTANAAIIDSVTDLGWMNPATWGGTTPAAGDGNTYRALHDMYKSDGASAAAFAGDALVFGPGGGMRANNTFNGTFDLGNATATVEAGGSPFNGSSNRNNDFEGPSLIFLGDASHSTAGRNHFWEFDKYTQPAGSTWSIIANNPEMEFKDGPGTGDPDFSAFLGTIEVQNNQGGVGNYDLAFHFDIPTATFDVKLNDREVADGGTVLNTYYQIRNDLNQTFTAFNVHSEVLTNDVDGDGKYDPADGDTLEIKDISIPAGTYTQAQLVALDATLANHFYDQGNGTGTITIIPEPASLALMGIGGLLIAARRRW